MINSKYYFFSLLFLIINLLSSCGSDRASVILDDEEPVIYKYGYDESKHIFQEKKLGEVILSETYLKLKVLSILKYIKL